MPPSELDVEGLVRAGRLGVVEHHPVLTSSNDRARELAATLPAEQTALVVVDRQTAGRGRGANRWWTGPGSLACSLLFDPARHGIQRADFPLISLATAIAIIDVVRPALAGVPLGLHWPNDVFAAGRKLSGVLVEVLPDGQHIVGIGLNLATRTIDAPAELRQQITSVADLTGSDHDRNHTLRELIDRLWSGFDQLSADPASVGRRANEVCLQHGRQLTISSGDRRVTGCCLGVADDGALLLDTPSGVQRFYSGVLIHGTD